MIRIEVESTVPSGNYTATAYQEGQNGVLCSAAHGTRLTAIANCLTALAALPGEQIDGDLELQPITIVTPRPRSVV